MTMEKLVEEAKEIRDNLLISKHRKTIEKLFKSTTPTEEDITVRLVVIDSLFSTNSIRMRSNSIYTLAGKIHGITKGNDANFCNYALDYLKNKKYQDEFFDGKYGGKEKGEHSLISKYCFFATGDFPMIDNFVIAFTKKIAKSINTNEERIIHQITAIKEHYKISYDEFDAIAWIYGKISDNGKTDKKNLFNMNGNNLLHGNNQNDDISKKVHDFKDHVYEFIKEAK